MFYLAEVQRRRVAASTLRSLGVAIDEIARHLGAGVRSVQRWISEISPLVRSAPSPSALSDFERVPRPLDGANAVSWFYFSPMKTSLVLGQ
jgi:hypothetical protein